MAVSVVFSRTPGGVPIADTLAGGSGGLDHGNVINGGDTAIEDVYIRHDGLFEITECAFYCAQYSGVYGGGASAAGDLVELIGWGDANPNTSVRFDTNHDDVFEYYLHTGVMDLAPNAVPLNDADAGGTTTDDIGDTGEAYIKIRISVPITEDQAGIRQFDTVMAYTYTG